MAFWTLEVWTTAIRTYDYIAGSCIFVCVLLHSGAWANAALLTFLLTAMRIMRIHTHTPPSILIIILFSEQHED